MPRCPRLGITAVFGHFPFPIMTVLIPSGLGSLVCSLGVFSPCSVLFSSKNLSVDPLAAGPFDSLPTEGERFPLTQGGLFTRAMCPKVPST